MLQSQSNTNTPNIRVPSIDVVVNFVNEFKYVGKAIKSLRKSEGIQVRIIVIDDSGKDNSEYFHELLNSNDLYKRSDRQGYIAALKLAESLLKSEFVGILNADDITDKHRLYNQVSTLDDDLDVCVGRLIKFKWSTRFHLPAITKAQAKGGYCHHLMYLGPIAADASWVMPREIFGNLFNSVFDSDWGIALENFRHLQVGIDNKSKYFYRQHSKQITRTSTFKFNSERNYIRKSLVEDFGLTDQIGFVEALSTPWNLEPSIAIKTFAEFTTKLKERHSLVCPNSKSFNKEVVRRLLLAVLNPNNSGRYLLRFKILVSHPLELCRLLRAIILTLVLRTGRSQ